MSDESIPISSDNGFIPIKATPENMLPLMKKRLQEKTDQLNAQHRQRLAQVRSKKKLKDGSVVVGNMTQDEVKAVESGNEALLRKVAKLRAKAQEMAMKRRMEGKSQGDYYQAMRNSMGYQGLSKHQARLPQSPYKDRDGFLEY